MAEFYTKIVGVTFNNDDGTNRQDLLEDLDVLPFPIQVHLKWEEDNPHDPHAVAVISPSGKKLGYLFRRLAFSVSNMLDTGHSIYAEITQLTGTEDIGHNYGANLRIEAEPPTFAA